MLPGEIRAQTLNRVNSCFTNGTKVTRFYVTSWSKEALEKEPNPFNLDPELDGYVDPDSIGN